MPTPPYGSASIDVALCDIDVGLLRLCSLPFWLAAGVPESGNIKRVALDVIDNLIESAYDDASIGFFTVGEQGVYLAHCWHVG